MTKINLFLAAILLIFITIGCEKDKNDSINLEIEEQKENQECDVISDYLDSTYLSFSIGDKEYTFYYLFGGLGASIQSYYDTDSIIIGFTVDGEDSYGDDVYLDFYYKISEKELIESDTARPDIFNVNNFDTLLKADDIGIRHDFVDSLSMVGAEISYFDKDGYLNTTNVSRYYEEINNVTIPVKNIDLANSHFTIEQRTELCDGYFLIEGKFQADIYNLNANEFRRLSTGKFQILMYH